MMMRKRQWHTFLLKLRKLSRKQLVVMTLILCIVSFLLYSFIFSSSLTNADESNLPMCSNHDTPIVQVFATIPWMIFRNLGRRCPSYVYTSLLQSAKHNRCVILIGEQACASTVDKVRQDLKKIMSSDHEIYFHNIKADLYSKAVSKLNAEFPHKWFWYYKRYYEFLCFVRFYVIQVFMERFNVEHALYQDSDTLLFSNVHSIVQKIEQRSDSGLTHSKPLDVALTTDSSGFTSAHFSLFSRAGLRDSLNFFQELFSKHMLTNVEGFSDMTAFNLYTFTSIPKEERWCKEYMPYEFRCGEHERFVVPPLTYKRKCDVLSLNHPALQLSQHTKGIFDLNFRADAEWRNGVPYKAGTDIQYIAIHFQGDKKWYMNQYTSVPAKCGSKTTCKCVNIACQNCQTCNSDGWT